MLLARSFSSSVGHSSPHPGTTFEVPTFPKQHSSQAGKSPPLTKRGHSPRQHCRVVLNEIYPKYLGTQLARSTDDGLPSTRELRLRPHFRKLWCGVTPLAQLGPVGATSRSTPVRPPDRLSAGGKSMEILSPGFRLSIFQPRAALFGLSIPPRTNIPRVCLSRGQWPSDGPRSAG